MLDGAGSRRLAKRNQPNPEARNEEWEGRSRPQIWNPRDDPCDSGASHGRSGSNPPYGTSSGLWVILPWRLGAVHEFTGIQAAMRNSGSGHRKAAGAGLGLLLWGSDTPKQNRNPFDDSAISIASRLEAPNPACVCRDVLSWRA